MTTTYLDRAIAGELANLSSTTAGRNKQLFISSASLYRFAEAGVIAEDAITDLLADAGSAAGLGRDEIRATLRSARKRAGRLSTEDAQVIREKCAGAAYTPTERSPRAPEPCDPPPAEWQQAGAAFVAFAQANMSDTAQSYLHKRGLSDKTIATFGIGYNPAGRWSERAKWGIERDNDPSNEHPDHIWLPQGTVIPEYYAGALWKIEIRQDKPRDPKKRYKTVTGSANVLAGADSIRPNRPAMLVEGPIDWLAVSQVAGDLIGVGRAGTTGAHRTRWIIALALASDVLVSLDADAPGDEGSAYWLDALPNARRWRPTWADPAQMLEDGADVRAWVLSGLHKAPEVYPVHPAFVDFWAECEARGWAGHIERHAKLCAAAGADYQATIATLRRAA